MLKRAREHDHVAHPHARVRREGDGANASSDDAPLRVLRLLITNADCAKRGLSDAIAVQIRAVVTGR